MSGIRIYCDDPRHDSPRPTSHQVFRGGAHLMDVCGSCALELQESIAFDPVWSAPLDVAIVPIEGMIL